MEFSLEDYNNLNATNTYFFPKNFFPYINIDRKKYKELEKQHANSGVNIKDAFRELKKRTGTEYFNKVYPAQSSALNFSESSFPAYRFLVPEVLTDDWLAIVDFHKKHSRDHALHQPLTAYIVSKLLGGGISNKSLQINNSNLLDLCVEQILESNKTGYIKDYLIGLGLDSSSQLLNNKAESREFWKSLFFETAMVAAIFHDIGYPWQYINRLNHSLKASDFSPNNLSVNAKHVYQSFYNRLILYPFNGYKPISSNTPCNWNDKLTDLISMSLSKTHGFPGALGFLYLNDLIREFPTRKELPFHQFCVDWAALGIMMHDLGKIYIGENGSFPENKQLRIEFDKDPLSSIITLADILEDFERPNVDFEILTQGSNFDYNFSCKSSRISLDDDTLIIDYIFDNRDGVAAKLPFIGKEEKEYFDPDTGYMDFSSIGINAVKMNAIT